jgi:hypothetical protein
VTRLLQAVATCDCDAAAEVLLGDPLAAYLDGVHQRLRPAELVGVEEQARRRLTTVVVASFLALSVVGALGL